ncbi:MAG: hypothetical protein V2I47_01805 [Bacteroidales bacterium]|jgi:hypothetical protein|nr:hypothetical protein [Bacteroidales bacterium]
MTKIKSVLLAIAFVVMLPLSGLLAQDAIPAGPAGTKVIYSPEKRMFPCKWRKKRIDPEVIRLDTAENQRMQAILDRSLRKYPSKLLKKNLKAIYVLKSMFFYGLEYGGTYYKRKVYLSNNGIVNGYSDAYLEGSFHHEFSSVLLNRHPRSFDRDSWQASSPAGFVYGNGGREALSMNATGLDLDSTLYRDGFLNEYSLASLEEDFNCFAEYIFRNDPGFWQAWESSEAIRRKTAILIRFYNRLDPVFTLEYFRGL